MTRKVFRQETGLVALGGTCRHLRGGGRRHSKSEARLDYVLPVLKTNKETNKKHQKWFW